MKTKEVDEIIKDLYNIDPTLKEYEDKIRDIVFEIYYQKPEIEINESFRNELKEKILNRIYELKRENRQNNIKVEENNNQSNFIILMKKINYVLTGSIVTVCLVGAFIYLLNANGTISFNKNLNQNNISNGLKSVDFDLSIKNSNKKFGNLFAQNTLANESAVDSRSSGSPAGLGIGGGGGVSSPMASGDAAVSSKIGILPYNPTIYKYKYSGDKNFLENLNESDYPVLKRIKNSTVTFNNSDLLSANSIDMSKFSNLKINNISIDEDKNYGYSLYMALTEGSLSISKNWAKWPQLDYGAQYSMDEVLKNDELIKIANDFAKNYNINLQNYTSPEVQTDYRVLYEKATDKNNFYVPTSSTVIYPLLVNGKEVYEQYGGKYGIMMSIGFKEKKVEYVNNIQTLQFESASYELNKDVDTILKIAENTDNYYVNDIKDAKIVEITLKDPKIVYAKIFTYDNTTNTSNEFLVPAVAFKTSGEYDPNTYNREYVLIPLAKDYIDQELDRIQELEKMPKASDNTTSGSTGSVGATEGPEILPMPYIQ